MKKVTSLPISAARASSRSGGIRRSQSRSSATSVAAASLEPPASPACAGIALSSTIRAPRRLPADALRRSAAITTRLSPPTGKVGSLHRRLISPDGSSVKVKVSYRLTATISDSIS